MDWVNLKNECPQCKTKLTKEEIYKNYIVDDIIGNF